MLHTLNPNQFYVKRGNVSYAEELEHRMSERTRGPVFASGCVRQESEEKG